MTHYALVHNYRLPSTNSAEDGYGDYPNHEMHVWRWCEAPDRNAAQRTFRKECPNKRFGFSSRVTEWFVYSLDEVREMRLPEHQFAVGVGYPLWHLDPTHPLYQPTPCAACEATEQNRRRRDAALTEGAPR